MYSIPACARIRAEPNEKHAGEYRFCTMRVLQEKLRKIRNKSRNSAQYVHYGTNIFVLQVRI